MKKSLFATLASIVASVCLSLSIPVMAQEPVVLEAVEVQESLASAFLEDVITKYNEAVVYPPLARMRNQQGQVMIEVAYSTDGKVASQLLKSSGHPLLDRAAVDAASRVDLASIFEGFQGRPATLKYRIPVTFELKG